MQDGTFYSFAADTEADMRDWIQTIKRVISTDNISQRSTRIDGGFAMTNIYKMREV